MVQRVTNMGRESVVRAALRRLDHLKAFGVSRHACKQEQAAGGGLPPSTGRIHSWATADTYKQQVLAFVKWARAKRGLRALREIDARAPELVASYLRAKQAEWRPSTLKTARSALRLFFEPVLGSQARKLGADVEIAPRRREEIVRSRFQTANDRRFAKELRAGKWRDLAAVAQATGLRRRELESVRVGDVRWEAGRLIVHVRHGKGGRERDVPVLRGKEDAVLRVIAGRDPAERIFSYVPSYMDVHAYRRQYARMLYRELTGGRVLPAKHGRLEPGSYDRAAALAVSRALGHNRLDVALRHYLR
ncbi:MAG: integrase [Bacillota bacterium]|nr:MAG: integrase [Bacillota bacterium]